MTTLAKAANMDYATFKSYNAGFKRKITPARTRYKLLIPAHKSKTFKLYFKKYHRPINWGLHIVEAGDTLSDIASNYNSNVKAILSSNQLKSSIIRPGQKLIIPSNL